MTDSRFRQRGYLKSNGKPLKEAKLIEGMELVVQRIECLGTQVKFWKVQRKLNTMANALVKAARGKSQRYCDLYDSFGQ